MLIIDHGNLKLYMEHLKLKRGVYYYFRRIPADLQARLGGKEWRSVSLRTKSKPEAARKVAKLSAQDDSAWSLMRDPENAASRLTPKDLTQAALATLKHLDVNPFSTGREREFDLEVIYDWIGPKYDAQREPDRNPYTGAHPPLSDYLNAHDQELVRLFKGDPAPQRLSNALEHYLKEHEQGRDARFSRDAIRAISFVLDTVGDHPLEFYKREHAEAVRDAMLASGNKTATVRRRITSISAVFADGIATFGLNLARHPFQKLRIRAEEEDSEKRIPFSIEELVVLAKAIRAKDDDMRYILGLQFNTGARLGEIVGLKVSDIVLDAPVPHLVIRPYPERRLKTPHSARKVPLVGLTLWAAQRAVEGCKGGVWLFPRYVSTGSEAKAGYAANTLNKWLRAQLGGVKRMTHCFRHALKDHLREVGVTEPLQEAIMGHGEQTHAKGYGTGYSLEKLHEGLLRVVMLVEAGTTGASERASGEDT